MIQSCSVLTNRIFTEFDECQLNNHGCEQTCTNTLGGYECACKIGYQLHSDNKHCEGETRLPESNCRRVEIKISFIPDTCGGRIDASNGTIASPSFPETYPGNKSCTWEIIAPPQFKITLNFTHFDLEGNNVRKFSAFMSDTLRSGKGSWVLFIFVGTSGES